MKFFPRANQIGLALVSFALLSSLLGVSPARAVPGPNAPVANSDSLFNSESLSAPESLGRIERNEVKAARAHLVANAAGWVVNPLEYQAAEAVSLAGGISAVRFTQFIDGVEVANSLLAITVTSNGALLSYTKATSDFSQETKAPITQEQAMSSLVKLLANENQISPEQVSISKMELVIVDDALVDDVPFGKYLAWRATTSISGSLTSLSLSYLSADGSTVLSTLPYVRGIAEDPFVCDMQFDVGNPGYVPQLGLIEERYGNRYVNISSGKLGYPLCRKDNIGLGAPETEIAKANIIRTWDYFSSVLGQDINAEAYLGNITSDLSITNEAVPRISAFVNVCATNGRAYACPYENAFWVPWVSPDCQSKACSGIFLGKDFDVADDVIAHELAHGVSFAIAFNSAMSETSETYALSEAVSDIFGEAMDQLNVTEGEAPDPNWILGEDVQAGGIRSLKNPQIARIDKNWIARDGHDNNGPVNKLAYLLANGGKVGKTNINPLGTVTNDGLCNSTDECTGISRMSQLVFATTSKLTASANYFDFGKQMVIACSDFANNNTDGFNKATCKNVASALKAQGFTSFKITRTTKLGSVSRGSKTVISAKASGTTGSPVVGQAMSLQIYRGNKWVTVKTASTDGSGVVKFRAKWGRSTTYRVISKTNGGIFSATGKTARVRVR